MSHEGILIGGPQDGAKVRSGTGEYPQELFAGRKRGTGFVPWRWKPSARFPARYWMQAGARGFVYRFCGLVEPTT